MDRLMDISILSDHTSDPREEDWPTDDSFMVAPDFSDPMLDHVSEEYQTLEIARVTGILGESSDEANGQTYTSTWIRELSHVMPLEQPNESRPWPNSNRTMGATCDEEETEDAGAKEAPKATSMMSTETAHVLREMSYVGGMNYARTRLQEAAAFKTSDKGKRVRPPALLTATSGPHGASRSSSPSSKATSGRSSAYRAVHEAAVARKALLDAQMEAREAVIQLSKKKADCDCDREHQVISEEIEAVQKELRMSNERQAQGQEMQTARMDAMGHRMIEMKDLMMHRECLMDAPMEDICSQIRIMTTMLNKAPPQPEVTAVKSLLTDTGTTLPKPPTKNVTLKTKKPSPSVGVQSTSKLIPQLFHQNVTDNTPPPTTSKSKSPTRLLSKKGTSKNPITIDISSMGITCLRRSLTNDDITQPTGTFHSANATLRDTNDDFQTANNEFPPGNPCASSTRRKDASLANVSDESVKSTRGSSLLPPTANDDEAPISPEQLRFTEAISKAMSKELAPPIANRNQTRARPTCTKVPKTARLMDGSS